MPEPILAALQFLGRTDTVVWGLLNLLLGTYLGHALTIRRDVGLSRLAATKPVRARLVRLAESPNPFVEIMAVDERDLIEAHLTRRQKRRFRACLADCQRANDEQAYQDRLGQVLYKDPHAVAAAIRRLIDTLPLR